MTTHCNYDASKFLFLPSLADISILHSVLAAEPHAVLPIGLIGLLSSDRLPNAHLGVTSAIFKVPLLRQVWSWLQLVPANKSDLTALLHAGRTIALVPGGVQECLHIEHGTEVSVSLEV